MDLEPDAYPPKVLAVGPDSAGNLLEVVWIDLEGGVELVIHAMRLRPRQTSSLSAWTLNFGLR